MKTHKRNNSYFISLLKISKAPLHLYGAMAISLIYLAGFNVILSYLIQLGLNTVLDKTIDVSLMTIAILLCTSCLLYMVASYLLPVYREKIFQYIAENLKKKLYINIIDQPLMESQKMSNGDYLTRMIEDCDNCCRYITRTVFVALQLIMNILFGVIYVCFFSWRIGLILILISPVFYILNKKNANRMGVAYGNFLEAEGKHRNLFEEIHANGSIIKIFSLKDKLLNKDKERYNIKYTHAKDQASSMSSMIFLTETGVMMIELTILVVGIFLVRLDLIALGTLIGIWNAAVGSIVYPTTELPFVLADVAEQYTSWERVSQFIDIKEPEQIYVEKSEAIPKELVLENVSFNYNDSKELFSEVNLSCKIGETVFVVGESGIGKSTLIKLMLNLYQPVQGEIYIETNDKKFKKQELQQLVSYVPQDNTIFELSIYENITMGLEDITHQQVVEAAKLANINSFIENLPNGYDTVVKDNINISTGQAQRIAIARAILRDTPFIIMDEPFSALDEENVNELIQTLKKLSETKGCIIVSHDKTSILSADKVIRINGGGRIEEAF